MVLNMEQRKIHYLNVTKNIQLLSSDKKSAKVVDFKLTEPQNKPLVVLLTWLMSKKPHIVKYAEFYSERGFDIMAISISPWQLLWPARGTQVVASEILKFLDANRSYGPVLLHGFSVGGYLWGEALVQMERERERYENIVSRIAGQVWDSVADVETISVGLPFAVVPNNPLMQSALRKYTECHMKAFDRIATCHYVKASKAFHSNIVKAPALFFLSKSDPIGTETAMAQARNSWEKSGIKVYWKCWDKSPHVGHFRTHPKEYLEELTNFVSVTGLMQQKEVLRAKL